jgi:O-antigen ligase
MTQATVPSHLSLGSTLALLAATLLPTSLAFSQPPSPTVYNQLLALALWGGAILVLAARPAAAGTVHSAAALLAALGLCVLATAVSMTAGSLPAGLGLSTIGVMLAAALVAGAAARAAGDAEVRFAFFTAVLIAGLCGAFIGFGQVFMPHALDGEWFALSSTPGRAVGNLRQPNHLATLLLWAALAVVPLHEAGRLRRSVAAAVVAALVFAVVLTASRTGLVGVVVLALWGLLDARRARFTRALLLAAPLLYLAGWMFMGWWAQATAQPFVMEARLASEGFTGSTRPLVWRDTLALIAAQPWLGVGAGEYNLAWSLTPSPRRSGEFFDHSHNLPLQLLAEYGVPLGGAVLALLLVALWQAWRRSAGDAGLRCAFVMVLLIGLHSLLEYPLWYAYFLLPTAFAWGLCLGAAAPPQPRDAAASRIIPWRAAGAAMVVMALLAFVDYRRVVAVYEPADGAAPLVERVAAGQRSWLFPHHADYAAATMAERPGEVMDAIRRASHYLLDTRLMIAWARAYAERGDTERARHIAARLREFGVGNPAAEAFFAPCAAAAASGVPPPAFPCTPPARAPDWRAFR